MSLFRSLYQYIVGYEEIRILMVGLDGAGKTTLLYKLKLDEVVKSIPTTGFNVETVVYKNLKMTIWDVGGRAKPLWRHYYCNTNTIIFVIDVTDINRINQVKEDFKQVLNENEVKNANILIFANKQDINSPVMTISQIADYLELHSIRDRKYYIQPCSSINGHGIYEGFDWIAQSLKDK